MKNLFLALSVSTILAGNPILAPTQAQDKTRPIAGLQDAGWKIVRKTEESKQLPGIAPYENLVRVVHVISYRMQKGSDMMLCQASFDTQRDRYDETCRPASH